MIREKIRKIISESLCNLLNSKELRENFLDFRVEIPSPWKIEDFVKTGKSSRSEYGDYTAVLYKITEGAYESGHYGAANFSKEEIELLREEIKKSPEFKKNFDKVDFKFPIFFNFFLSKEYLQKQIEEILKKSDDFGRLNSGKKQKIQVEFISANPTGPLHIGNGRGAFFGDVLSSVLEKAGYQVTREYYVNDAKSNTQINILGQTSLGKGVTYLTPDLKVKIEKLKLKLKEITDEGEAGHLLAREVQKDNKDFIEKKLKIKFDKWVFEEDLYQKSKIEKILTWLKKENLVYQKAGAWWIKTSQFGDNKDWVVIRETGEPTYLLSDIAYHQDKFNRGFKRIINIWGADHQGHVSKMKAVSKILGYKGALDILISQMIRLKGGLKLSKRKGEIITLEDLINEVGLDVARFLYLTKSLDTQMEFDIDLAKEQSQKNPVFYAQYVSARICSILRKAKTGGFKSQDFKLLTHPSESALIKELIRLPEIIEDAAKDYQVQRLPQYVLELATVFHRFYRDCRVISDNQKLTNARLGLVSATQIVLKNTLNLMGISAPERM